MKCIICGQEIDKQYDENGNMFWDSGHNAEPIAEGRCCTTCNYYKVVPARIEELINKSNK